MKIGQVAERSGVPAKTIRYYEDQGLLPAADRAGNGYRVYGKDDVHRLQFIARARSLGFSVKDVSLLLDLYADRDRASGDVKQLAREHVTAIDAKIVELQAMRSTLTRLMERCHGDDRPDCPILEDLAQAPVQSPS
ncbi:MAG: Cu(I)-responsive transcriptional regulator [Pseudomonadota bacterium]|nr:Cu(I)-responsive transcriptional regulator [Pseudomonadota bacterium]